MRNIFTIIILISISLAARENPFFPSKGEADITQTSNQIQTLEPLKRAAITLPSTSRTLESVTLKYKNLDGSIKEKSITLGNAIDWHLPVFISQNIDSTTKDKTTKKKESYKKIAALKFIALYEAKKSLIIKTKDKMIRDFLLTKPHRIVCDFQRDIDIRSYEKNINVDSIVTKVRLGNHKGYYRVVIELDGYYKYKLQKSKGSYKFLFL